MGDTASVWVAIQLCGVGVALLAVPAVVVLWAKINTDDSYIRSSNISTLKTLAELTHTLERSTDQTQDRHGELMACIRSQTDLIRDDIARRNQSIQDGVDAVAKGIQIYVEGGQGGSATGGEGGATTSGDVNVNQDQKNG